MTLQPNRPIVLLSSTSWTPDEKFEILLDALVQYDKVRDLPRILMIITGKGPLKDAYIEEIQRNNLKNVDVLTPWLEADDYPKILASADLGISLHTSTSGVDLPMKVVDMFGAKVPVLAKRFKCIGELVKVRIATFLRNSLDRSGCCLSTNNVATVLTNLEYFDNKKPKIYKI